MAYADMKPRQRTGLIMAFVGILLIGLREPAERIAQRMGPASEAVVALVFGVVGPLVLLIGAYNLITGRNDRTRS